MIFAGARKVSPLAGAADPDHSSRFSTPPRLALAAALCGALAGCSAHERGLASSETPAASQQTAVAVGGDVAVEAAGSTVAAAPAGGLQPGAVQVAASAPTPAAGGTAVPAPAQSLAAARRAPVADAAPIVRAGRSSVGLASWYGDGFHGRPTANGERFDMGSLSAAHRSFPLPSYVRVTNVSNGRSVVVRVNDRGPFHGGRVIDVSRRTADLLGFRSGGVGNVKLDLIGPAPEGRSDDRRLLASYQEFGRPAVAPGQQIAMGPVSDQDLAREAMGYSGRAFAVASAAVTDSAAFVKSSAAQVVSTASDAASSATAAVGRALTPARPADWPTAVARAATPAPVTASAYAAQTPALASAPEAITAPVAGKPRVIAPADPVLASAGPALSAAPATRTAQMDVTSRIAAGFDSFDAFAPRAGGTR